MILGYEPDQAFGQELISVGQELGHKVTLAGSPEEVLAVLTEEPIDLLIISGEYQESDLLQKLSQADLEEPAPAILVTQTPDAPVRVPISQLIGSAGLISLPISSLQLAQRITQALTARHSEQEHSRLAVKLNRLVEVGRELGEEHDFERLFALVMAKTSEIMEAERSSLFLVDKKTNEIWTMVAEGVDEIRMPFGQGVCGRVIETDRSIRVGDAWELDFFDRSWDRRNNFRTRSMLCVPVKDRKRLPVGAIQVINRKNGREFTAEDERVLRALAAQAAIALENAALLEELRESFESFVRTLTATVDARHPLTAGHSERVTAYSLIIGRQLGLGEEALEQLKYSGLLHDIGKLGVPDSILLKNGRFTDEERDIMKTHSSQSETILSNIHFPEVLQDVALLAGAHHERYDGKGYSYGLVGLDIAPLARVIAVADVFDALTSPRDYPKYDGEATMSHAPMPLKKAISIILGDAGTAFDPEVVEAFQTCLDELLDSQLGGHFPEEYVAAYREAE